MTKLTKAQRARLDKLATYLEGLPVDYAHFDMRDYLYGHDESAAVVEYARRNGGVGSCGTAACAVGHGPAAGVLFPRRFLRETIFSPVNWDGYASLFVGGIRHGDSGKAYRWCFGGEWASRDNSHYGAAARIRYLLDHGAPPAKYREEADREMVAIYAPYRIDAKRLATLDEGRVRS